MDIERRLDRERVAWLVHVLGFDPVDRDAILLARDVMLAGDDDRLRLARCVAAVVGLAGDYLAPTVFTAADAAHRLGFGAPLILAFLATHEEAVAWRSGQPRELVDAALADLAQQVRVNRLVHHDLGLREEAQHWVQGNWAGGMLRLGRLQFNLERQQVDLPGCPAGTVSRFVHIPEAGPLQPDEVTASFALAGPLLARHYAHGGNDFFCASWLLDPAVVAISGAGSNLGRFACRFTPPLALLPNDRDPVFYAFHAEPPVDLAALPRDTRLRKGIVEHLEAGRHFHTAICRWVG